MTVLFLALPDRLATSHQTRLSVLLPLFLNGQPSIQALLEQCLRNHLPAGSFLFIREDSEERKCV